MIRPIRCRSISTTVWILLYCFALEIMQLKSDRREIEVFKSDSVLLKCRSNASTNILWYHYKTVVSRVKKVYLPYKDRFSIRESQSTGDLNLCIANVKLEDSGIYKCVNPELMWEDKPILLVVIGSNPMCSSNMGSESFIGPNTCNLEQDKMIFSCSVPFHGPTRPQLKWRLLSDSHVFNESECSYKNNRINCTLIMTADTAHDGSVFTCQTAKAIETQYTCNISNIRVQYFSLTNDSIKEKNVGQRVSCLVNTSQTVTFYWKLSHDGSDQIVSNDQSLVLQEPGLYRCDVAYNIKNHECFTLVSTFNVQEGNKQVAIIAAPSIIITLLLVAIIALFVLYRLYKRKRKPQNVILYMNEQPGESHPLIDTTTMTSSFPTSNEIVEKELKENKNKGRSNELDSVLVMEESGRSNELDSVLVMEESGRFDELDSVAMIEESGRSNELDSVLVVEESELKLMEGEVGQREEDEDSGQNKKEMEKQTDKIATITLYDLPEEVLDVIIQNSYFILALKIHSNNLRDAEIIRFLASVDYLWFKRIINRKRGILFQISAYFKKTKKTSMIVRNNRQFLLKSIHPTNDLIANLCERKCISSAEGAFLNLRAKRTRDKSDDLFNLMRPPTSDRYLEFLKCFQEVKQWTIARVILNGGIVTTIVTRTPDSVKQLVQRLRNATIYQQPSCSSEFQIEIINSKEVSKNKTVFWIWMKSQRVYKALQSLIESGCASTFEEDFTKNTSIDDDQLSKTFVSCQTVKTLSAQRIKEHCDLLLQSKTDINLFIDRLRTKGVIDSSQENVIKQEIDLREKVILMQTWLEECGVVQNYKDFLQEMKGGLKVTPDRILEQKDLVIEMLDPDSVLEKLLSYKALTYREMFKINDIDKQREKAERLIDVVLEKNLTTSFIKALNETNQSHLTNYLATNGCCSQELFGDDRPLIKDQMHVLNSSELIERINPHDILSRLSTNRVISARQMNIISAKQSDTEKNKALLDIIRCGSKERYQMFILSLLETGHKEVVQFLLDQRVCENKESEPHVQNKSEDQVSKAFATILADKTSEEVQNVLENTRRLHLKNLEKESKPGNDLPE